MTTEEQLKSTIDEIGKSVEAFKTAHADEIKDLKKGFDDVVKKDLFVKLNTTI
jgi:septation ring formation regulator EzrA